VVAGGLQDPFTAESYAPELVGQRRQILVGKKSGLVSIAHKIQEMGLVLPEELFPEMLARVKATAVRQHRALTDQEFKGLADELLR
jgi:isopropylmalate/homocitrate/citramalate synthase